MQSRLMSLIEAKANILVGLATSYLANMLILPHVLGITVSQGQIGVITLLFTGVSLVRSYALRRWFAKRTG